MSRHVAATVFAIGTIAILSAAGCATKVGDHVPGPFTAFKSDRLVLDLDKSEAIRLCLDIKQMLGNDEKLGGACALKGLFSGTEGESPDQCEQRIRACWRDTPTAGWPDLSDCPQFALNVRNCGALTIGELGECMTWHAGQWVTLARAGSRVCRDPSVLQGLFADKVDACNRVSSACKVDEVDLL